MATVGGVDAEEGARTAARQKELLSHTSVTKDPMVLINMDMPRVCMAGCLPMSWNGGRMLTHADQYDYMCVCRDEWAPLLRQACDQSVGARR